MTAPSADEATRSAADTLRYGVTNAATVGSPDRLARLTALWRLLDSTARTADLLDEDRAALADTVASLASSDPRFDDDDD